MASREIIISLRLSEGSTREQFRALKGALIDVNQEITANNKALRENGAQQKKLSDEIKAAGVATEAQAAKERVLAEQRIQLKRTAADLGESEATLSKQISQTKNDLIGVEAAQEKLRQSMIAATEASFKQRDGLASVEQRAKLLAAQTNALFEAFKKGDRSKQFFAEINAALIDTRAELTKNKSALAQNKKAQDELTSSVHLAGVATKEQTEELDRLASERTQLQAVNTQLNISEGQLSNVFREVGNDVKKLTENGLRFRDKMAEASLEAIKQSGLLGQLGARMDFLATETDRLNKEFTEGKIKEEEFRASTQKLEQEMRELGTQTTQINGKLNILEQEFKEGKITAEQFRASVSQINTAVTNVGGAVKAGVADLKSFALSFVGVIAVAQGAITAIKSVSNTIADFDQQLANIRSLGQEYAASIDEIAKAAVELGPKLGVAPVEALKGFEALAKAGLTTQQILTGGLQSALLLTAAGEVEVGEAAETIAAALTQFNLKGEQAVKITDLLAKGANIAQGNVSDFAAALNQSGLVASQFGLSIEETIGGLTAFAKAGLIGSDAGTSFRQALLRLQNPTEKSQKVMDQYGITVANASGEFFSLEEIAGQLKKQLADLTEVQRGAALATIFGQDAIRVANILYREGAEGVARYTKEVNDSGFANQVAQTKLDSISGSAKKFGAAWDAMVLDVDSGNSILSKGIRGLIDAANEFLTILGGNNEFQKFKDDLELILEESGLDDRFGAQAEEAENKISGFLSSIRRVKKDIKDPLELKVSLEGAALSIQDEIAKVRKELEDGDIAPKIGESKIFALEILLEDEINAALDDQRESLKKISAERGGIIEKNKEAIALVDQEGDETETLLQKRQRLTEDLKAEKAARDQLALTDTEGIKAANDRIVAIKAELDALKSFSFESKNVSGGLADLNDRIESLKKQQSQSTTSAQFNAYQAQIDKLNESVDLLTGKLVEAPSISEFQFIATGNEDAGAPPADPNEDAIVQSRIAAGEILDELRFDALDKEAQFTAQLAQLDADYNAKRILTADEYYARKKELETAQAQFEKENFQATLGAASNLFSGLSQLAKDNSKEQKALAIVSALINTYLGVTQALASIPPPGSYVAAAASLVAGLAAVAKISSTGFDDGGFTPSGAKHKAVGVVHASEWVAPKWQVEHPVYGPIIDFLEGQRARRGGMSAIPFATGGHPYQTHGTALVNFPTNPSTGITAQRWSELQALAIQSAASDRPIFTRITDINKMQRSVVLTDNLASA